MFEGIRNGMLLITESLKALKRYPQMMVPMLISWVIYAAILTVLAFYTPWGSYGLSVQVAIVLLVVLSLSSIFSWSSFVLLELMKQIETGKQADIKKAFFVSKTNMLAALPIVALWAIVWFATIIIEAILSQKESDGTQETKHGAKGETLYSHGELSVSSTLFEALRKGVRMLAFIVYPAIAWESLGTVESIKKGFAVARAHKKEFAIGFVLTGLVSGVVFAPPLFFIYVSIETDTNFPDIVWFGVLMYSTLAWSLMMFVEQMYVAELYLWHLIWEKEVSDAEAAGELKPKPSDVKRPSIIDNIADMNLTHIDHKDS